MLIVDRHITLLGKGLVAPDPQTRIIDGPRLLALPDLRADEVAYAHQDKRDWPRAQDIQFQKRWAFHVATLLHIGGITTTPWMAQHVQLDYQ